MVSAPMAIPSSMAAAAASAFSRARASASSRGDAALTPFSSTSGIIISYSMPRSASSSPPAGRRRGQHDALRLSTHGSIIAQGTAPSRTAKWLILASDKGSQRTAFRRPQCRWFVCRWPAANILFRLAGRVARRSLCRRPRTGRGGRAYDSVGPRAADVMLKYRSPVSGMTVTTRWLSSIFGRHLERGPHRRAGGRCADQQARSSAEAAPWWPRRRRR